ncbi:MAG: restriction endonuclease, partial [Deltaproteobacteria bacterium]|nr:restriction endonuclease [Deltaproteobacteria bacterium]
RIGYTKEEYNGDVIGVDLYHKYKGTDLEEAHNGVLELFNKYIPIMIQEAQSYGKKSLDPGLFMRAVAQKYGRVGLDMAMERIEVLDRGQKLNPNSGLRYTEWSNIESLETLFKGGSGRPEAGKFIDQRFINYLYANHDKLSNIHWRKFEELTAEYFEREGYNVELGPGTNDDGIDVRVWESTQNQDESPPHIIIQCKRQKKKIEKVVIKGLYADMKFLEAKYGLIVTSSELSPGARKTISARGYSIQEIDNAGIRTWLEVLHVPGTGIVRV